MRISDWSSDVCSSDLKKSTSQIRQILGKIQSATSSAVMVVEEGTKRVNETIETVNRAGDTIGSLGDAIAENARAAAQIRSEEHTSELQSLMRISYAVFCLKKKKKQIDHIKTTRQEQTQTSSITTKRNS